MFREAAEELGLLLERKNVAYGDSFRQSGKILAILFPDGVDTDRYDDLLAIARVIDKLFRLANRKDAFGESPWQDIAGYGLLGVIRDGHNDQDSA